MELFDRIVSLVHFLLLSYIEKSELVTWKQKLNTVIMSMAIKWQCYKQKFCLKLCRTFRRISRVPRNLSQGTRRTHHNTTTCLDQRIYSIHFNILYISVDSKDALVKTSAFGTHQRIVAIMEVRMRKG